MYIVFEGIVGSGKTTQASLLQDYLQKQFPKKEIVLTREPGGSEIADDIRKTAQVPSFTEEMDPICEAYLYAASRAHTLRSVVKPVLKNNGIVISDRNFFSSIAFQGYGRELGFDKVFEINKIAVDGVYPDITFYLDLAPKVGLKRTYDHSNDKFESLPLDFFQRAEKGYKVLSKHPLFKKNWHTMDASQSIETIFQQTSIICAKMMPRHH